MKSVKNLKTRLISMAIAALVLTACVEGKSQEKKSKDVKPFKIVLQKTEDGIKMKSQAGSAWIDLAFAVATEHPQAIDEYGMTKLNNVSADKNPKLADYLFTITKTEDAIVLKGMEGTAWTDLSFSLGKNEQQVIDQLGMVK